MVGAQGGQLTRVNLPNCVQPEAPLQTTAQYMLWEPAGRCPQFLTKIHGPAVDPAGPARGHPHKVTQRQGAGALMRASSRCRDSCCFCMASRSTCSSRLAWSMRWYCRSPASFSLLVRLSASYSRCSVMASVFRLACRSRRGQGRRPTAGRQALPTATANFWSAIDSQHQSSQDFKSQSKKKIIHKKLPNFHKMDPSIHGTFIAACFEKYINVRNKNFSSSKISEPVCRIDRNEAPSLRGTPQGWRWSAPADSLNRAPLGSRHNPSHKSSQFTIILLITMQMRLWRVFFKYKTTITNEVLTGRCVM